MRNFFLAVTSFLATVILLSQVALAQEAGWYTEATITAAPGEEPKINTDAARSNGKKGYTEGASPDSAEESPCTTPTCKRLRADVKRRGDYTTSPAKSSAGSGGGSGSSSQGQEGDR